MEEVQYNLGYSKVRNNVKHAWVNVYVPVNVTNGRREEMSKY